MDQEYGTPHRPRKASDAASKAKTADTRKPEHRRDRDRPRRHANDGERPHRERKSRDERNGEHHRHRRRRRHHHADAGHRAHHGHRDGHRHHSKDSPGQDHGANRHHRHAKERKPSVISRMAHGLAKLCKPLLVGSKEVGLVADKHEKHDRRHRPSSNDKRQHNSDGEVRHNISAPVGPADLRRSAVDAPAAELRKEIKPEQVSGIMGQVPAGVKHVNPPGHRANSERAHVIDREPAVPRPLEPLFPRAADYQDVRKREKQRDTQCTVFPGMSAFQTEIPEQQRRHHQRKPKEPAPPMPKTPPPPVPGPSTRPLNPRDETAWQKHKQPQPMNTAAPARKRPSDVSPTTVLPRSPEMPRRHHIPYAESSRDAWPKCFLDCGRLVDPLYSDADMCETCYSLHHGARASASASDKSKGKGKGRASPERRPDAPRKADPDTVSRMWLRSAFHPDDPRAKRDNQPPLPPLRAEPPFPKAPDYEPPREPSDDASWETDYVPQTMKKTARKRGDSPSSEYSTMRGAQEHWGARSGPSRKPSNAGNLNTEWQQWEHDDGWGGRLKSTIDGYKKPKGR